MNKTKNNTLSVSASVMAVDINGLTALLSCGEQTARKIAEKANARIDCDSKRVLYSVERIRNYLADTDKF